MISCIIVDKLRENIRTVVNICLTTENDDMAWLLMYMLRMVSRLKLFEKIDLEISHYYTITHNMFLKVLENKMQIMDLYPLSKIWICAFRVKNNTFQIDTLDKLTTIATIFCIDLSRKLSKVVSGFGKFKMTENTKLRLHIIYLTLIAFPLVNYLANHWVYKMLLKLHSYAQRFIEKNVYAEFPFENKFVFTQYYIKSLVTLNIRVSNLDRKMIYWVFDILSTTQVLSNLFYSSELHYSYLYSYYILDMFEVS
ncbi:hypothetical protein RF11_12382 [Thelohanellus kitauei]|uniref:Uncharacterized protein n=1 Tax=Thelohanellus kitauei TaxID=669202 RepID=A0A0C2JU51_THEKT|nr:hypothetical protein RF11_12382 [Thelohanellus kitauei]